MLNYQNLKSNRNKKKLVRFFISLCNEITKKVNRYKKIQVKNKNSKDFDPVTNLDRLIEKYIRFRIGKSFPDHKIVGEEFDDKKTKSDYTWVIDPIDGTTNFLHGIPHFCISVAFMSDQEIISGVIYDPIKNEIFYAEKNLGAFYNNQRIRVSKKNNLDDCLFGSNISGIIKDEINLRISGSAALDLAYVASGRLDGFYQNKLNIWDIAAGIIIISEAGGITSQIDTKKIKNHKIIAASETIYKDLTNLITNF